MTTRHYINLQNTIISIEDINFWPQIYLIFYLSLENSTTHTTIMYVSGNNFKDYEKNYRLEERRRENNTVPIWKMCAHTFWVVLRGGFVQLSCFLRLRRLPWILLLSPRPWQNSWSSPRPDVRRRDVPVIKVTKHKVNPYALS